jgi:UPF0755 protein
MSGLIKKLFMSLSFAVSIGIAFLIYFYFFQFQPPKNFPATAVVTVKSGQGVSGIAAELKKQNIIQSEMWFVGSVQLLKYERKVVAGDYYFDRPMNVFQVARHLTQGNFQIDQLKTTIPEGSTVYDISDIIHKNYPDFDTSKFILLALPKEGYLFPDTYKFGAHVTPELAIDTMYKNFTQKMEDENLKSEIKKHGRPLEEVIIMASILEGEARQTRTREIVAGILWERIRIDMPLQVDAAFRYVNGKTSEELTLDDLKIESPYNTYLHKGLPPGPISNPGLDSIRAAVNPIATDYLYFLTDKDGKMHYAETFEEHQENIDLYL